MITIRNKFAFIVLAISLLLVLSFCYKTSYVSAGTGNIIDFNDNGNSDSDDYSGSGGSIDIGTLFWIISFLFEHPVLGTFVIIIIAILYFSSGKRKRNQKQQTGRTNNSSNIRRDYNLPQNKTVEITNIIKQADPNFSPDAFITWVKEVYSTLDEAFCSLEWDKVRPFESNEMYATHKKQIDEYKNSNTQPKTERLFINKVYLTNFKKDENYEYLEVLIDSRFEHYIIDSETKALIKGTKDRTYYVNVIYKFKRSVGVLTKLEGSNESTTNCPNCGGTLEITSSGKCEWCGSVITTGEYDWVLNDIEKLTQS